ncbi:E3 ubiquitin-protein ligase FANCL isoform X2 [Nymphalis io]|uniref:E3 ubiquitin-protein ligase FANCL isoform X2 n=1 Tax=Inachis io TaxID=171585 RepID=UPI00216A6776|nr:E3 ubiquitin-protein ligase FANCL isoform X2 [Nymphalis io]
MYKSLDRLHGFFLEKNIKTIDTVSLDIIDKEFIEEVRNLPEDISLSFGRSLRELKCSVQDYEIQRVHEIFLKYNGLHKLSISGVNLPQSQLQECEYSSIEEVVLAFRQYINSLSSYFHELESIDTSFTVMEPINPTFKDDYRRILLDERTWLHVEVTTNGSATNIHLVGQSEHWHEKLQAGLLAWDHDKNIVNNITDIFDLMKSSPIVKQFDNIETINDNKVEVPSCAICFCVELPDNPGVPQPVCQNPKCGVYYHKSCLFQLIDLFR